MDAKLLTQSGWKSIASQFKLRDNGLLGALSNYEKLAASKYSERIAALELISSLAAKLKKDSLVSLIPRATHYLDDMVEAGESVATQISKVKVDVDQKESADARQDEEAAKACVARLSAAIQKLKSSPNLSFEFLVCDAKPHCGLMIAKSITAQHKEELSRLTGGSKRFLPMGTCCFADGKLTFNLNQSVSGLAKKLQDAIKFFTGKKLPVVVGAESSDGDEE